MKDRKTLFIVIIGLCVLAVVAGLLTQVKSSNKRKEDNNHINYVEADETAKSDFEDIFDDKFDKTGSELIQADKLNENEGLVYGITVQDNNDFYDMSVNLPVININTIIGNKLNQNTQNIFANKANAIQEKKEGQSIYTTTYTSYLKDNILYTVIKSTLKEDENPQRVIVQTYAYDLPENKELTIEKAIELVGSTKEEVEEKIKDQITKKINESNGLNNSGYNIYKRDLESDIYKLENIDTFYISKDGRLNIIFAYGNNDFTSEMDIIVI